MSHAWKFYGNQESMNVSFCLILHLQEEIQSGGTTPSGSGSTPATTPGAKSEVEQEQEGEESEGTAKKEVFIFK